MERTFALRRGRMQATTVVIGAFALLALPTILPVFWLHLVNGCLIAIIGAVALNLLTGNARLVSLGQAAFLGIGAFTAGLLERAYDVSFPVAIVGRPLRAASSASPWHSCRCGCASFTWQSPRWFSTL